MSFIRRRRRNLMSCGPSLVLNCDKGLALHPRITSTRASSGTYRDSAVVHQTAGNNVARFNHDVNGNPLGLLIEESRQNIVLQSDDFGTTWSNTFGGGVTLTLNDQTAPDGSMTADKIEQIDASNDGIQQVRALSNNTEYAVSVFWRNDDAARSELRMWDQVATATHAQIQFNWIAGVPSTHSSAAASNITYENWGSGWYWTSFTFTSPADASDMRPVFFPEISGVDAGKGGWVWRAQLEPGAFPTSPIATTTTAVTRAADVASITGTDFSDWFNATEGTFVVEYDLSGFNGSGFQNILAVSDGTGNNRINLLVDAATGVPTSQIWAGGVLQHNTNHAAISSGGLVKQAIAYEANNVAAALNGVAGSTDTTVTLPTVDRANIGQNASGGGALLNGHIRRLTYYPTRLSNAQLQALTS